MDLRFDAIQSHPANEVFHVVFFPDRVYHASYLNATRSSRYTYVVDEVRSKSDAMVLKGSVRLDDFTLTNFLRIEYRAGRLTEQTRLKQRFVGGTVICWIKIEPKNGQAVETRVKLTYCPWTDAHQAEIWGSLEVPDGQFHDIKVLDMMGAGGSITRVPSFSPALQTPKEIAKVYLAFREGPVHEPFGYGITDTNSGWDNFFDRTIQRPDFNNPSDPRNTIDAKNYQIDFQRGWYFQNVKSIAPVSYRNAMMLDSDIQKFADRFYNGNAANMHSNITEMRWIFQQELGSNLVFFHEVTVPVGGVEGTHQHIGSEELYFVTAGKGVAYMGENDDPSLSAQVPQYPLVSMPIFGLDERKMWEVPVEPGSVIFTKSGGMHGIRNTGTEELKFVAFLYHSS